MNVIVIIPVKSSNAKSRLSRVLSPAQRSELSNMLLVVVLSAVRKAGLISSAYVVSSDRSVLQLAKRSGARISPEETDAGVNQAVLLGLREARQGDSALVIPSDLPLLKPSDLDGIISLGAAGIDVIISPSRAFDGTNALMFPAASKFLLRYDDNSFWNHVSGAARLGLSLGICTRPGLMFDVDTPKDLGWLAHSKTGGIVSRFAKEVLS